MSSKKVSFSKDGYAKSKVYIQEKLDFDFGVGNVEILWDEKLLKSDELVQPILFCCQDILNSPEMLSAVKQRAGELIVECGGEFPELWKEKK